MAVLIIFPVIHQTVINLRMLSIQERGDAECKSPKNPTKAVWNEQQCISVFKRTHTL